MRIKTKIMAAFAVLFAVAMTACDGAEVSTTNSVEPSVVESSATSVAESAATSVANSVANSVAASVGTSVATGTGWTTAEQSEMITYMGEVLPYMPEFGTDYYFDAEYDDEGGYVYIEVKGNHLNSYSSKIVALGYTLEEQGTDAEYGCDYAWYIKEKNAATDYVVELSYYPVDNDFVIFAYPWTY